MTSWYSGNGDRDEELLSHGDDTAPLRPVRLFAAAALLLVLGAALGTRIDGALRWLGLRGADVELTGGAVAAATSVNDRHQFRVGVFNPGEETVHVRVVGLDGGVTAVTPGRPVAVAPHSWRHPSFSVPFLCDETALSTVAAVRVRASTTAGSSEQRVELAAPALALAVVHDRECAPPAALGRRDLGGLWVVEDYEGRWASLARVGLLRFTADGRFAFDPEGHLFQEGRQGMFGTYRLHGTRLQLQTGGGYACGKGYREVWTTARLEPELLRLDIVRSDPGYCHTPPGDREFLRRVVKEGGLPPVRARERPACTESAPRNARIAEWALKSVGACP